MVNIEWIPGVGVTVGYSLEDKLNVRWWNFMDPRPPERPERRAGQDGLWPRFMGHRVPLGGDPT